MSDNIIKDDFEIVTQEQKEAKERQLAALGVPHDTAKFVVKLQQRLKEKGVDEDFIVNKIIDLVDTTITTNSGETYKDGKTNLEAVKLILQVLGMKGLGNTTNIAFFSGTPAPNGKLEY